MKMKFGIKIGIALLAILIGVLGFGKMEVKAIIYNDLPVSVTKFDPNDNSCVFPESYQQYIRNLKAAHPNWVFKAVYTNLDWNTTITHESYDVNRGISTVPDSYPDAWKKDGTNQGNYVDGNFVVASKEAVAYCLDPRNFLEENTVFQFETLSYSDSNSNISTIDKMLSSTVMGASGYTKKYKNAGNWIGMEKTYSQIIQEAGKKTGVSPIYIASRIKQETAGNIANNLSINGSYPGYEGLYNFYNIGATPNADGGGAIANGLARARKEGWTTPESSIHGGIDIIKNSYIKWGQDTVYFQKFDVNNPKGEAKYLYGHQYMTNILAPASESKIASAAYKNVGLLNDAFEFCIPIYNNMPSSNVSYPGYTSLLNVETNINGNTYKDKIRIEGWFMSTDPNAKIKVTVDGKDTGEQVIRTVRDDVLNTINGYGGRENNPKPGFYVDLDCKKLSDDKHTIAIEAISSSGQVLQSQYHEVTVEKYASRLTVETPVDKLSVQRMMPIEGWVLSEAPGTQIKLKINGLDQGPEIQRISRLDVINAVPGYGGAANNPTPGFKTMIDTALLSYGTNILLVQVYSNNGELLKEQEIVFDIKKFDTRLNLEIPNDNDTAKQQLTVEGWMMSEDKNATINVYIDNRLMAKNLERTFRPDVLNGVPGYGGATNNPKPGFNAKIDTTTLLDGDYELKLEAVDSYGRVLNTQKRLITIQKYNSRMNLETPEGNAVYANKLQVAGWVMSEDKNAILKLYVDGKEIKADFSRSKRGDVLNSVTNCGGVESNENPGFEAFVDMNNIGIGKHHIQLNIISSTTKDEVICSMSKEIEVKRPSARLNVETVTNNSQNIYIGGWVMSDDFQADISIQIDGKKITEIIKRSARGDVLNAVTDFGGKQTNTQPGFEVTIPVNGLAYGSHEVTIASVSSRGDVIVKENRVISIIPPATRLNIEVPSVTTLEGTSLLVEGWMMSESPNANVQITLDGKDLAVTRGSRMDVINGVKGFGDITTTPLPGFTSRTDIQNIADGQHTIDIKVFSTDKKILVQETKRVQIKKYTSTMCLETPDIINAAVDSWTIDGWIMSTDPNLTIKVYIDDKQITQTVKRTSRLDVINAVKGFGGATVNPLPGFVFDISSQQITAGYHTIRIDLISSYQETIQSVSKQVEIRK